MTLKHLFITLTAVSLTACFNSKKQQATDSTFKKDDLSLRIDHKPYKKVDSFAVKEIKDWKEYFFLEEEMEKYQSISAREALDNAIHIKRLLKTIKDSTKIDIYKLPPLKARFNVFENEILRLTDMAIIPAIKANEVNAQVAKSLLVYSSINTKINDIYINEKLNSEIAIDSLFNQGFH